MEPLSHRAPPSQLNSPQRSSPDSASHERLIADLTSLRRHANLLQIAFTSHRSILGWAAILLKKTLHRLLTPILDRQMAYNTANAQLVTHLAEQVYDLKQQLEALRQQQFKTMRGQEADASQQAPEVENQPDTRAIGHWQQAIDLRELRENWDAFGKIDPLWAILTSPDKKGNRWDLEEFFRLGRHEIEDIMRHIPTLGIELQHRRALDFGCGVGRITQALAPLFDEVYGVDIAPAMIDLAKTYNRYGEKCRYVVNDSTELKSFDDEAFDFIYTIITLQHIKPPYIKGYLREFMRVLAPAGLLVFQLPSERAAPGGERQAASAPPSASLYYPASYQQPFMEMHSIPKDEVVGWLEGHGGKVLEVMDDQSAGPDWVSFRYFVSKP